MGKKLTIYDLAKISGFSPKTVSRVVNNEGNVSPTTEGKIRTLIAELNYTPNTYAQNLKARKEKTILLSIRTTNGFPLQWMQMIIEQVGIYCLDRGITVLVEYFYDEERLEKSIISRQTGYLDGVIVFYETENDVRIKELKNRNIPFVVFERAYDETVPFVGNDNYSALFNLFMELCRKGAKTADLLLRSDTLVNRDRVSGVLDAFRRNNIDTDNVEVSYGIGNAEAAYEHIMRRYSEGKQREIYFVSGDERALGAYKAFKELGVEIGEDVSLIGFDDIPISLYLDPALTTIRPSYRELAEALVEIIFREEKDDAVSCQISVPSSLKIRGSLQKQYWM